MSVTSCVSTVSGTITVEFEKFSQMVTFKSRPVLFYNTTWEINIYSSGEFSENEMVSCFLKNRSLNPCQVQYSLCAIDKTGNEALKKDVSLHSIPSGGSRGYPGFAKFAALLATCTDTGKLTIRASIILHPLKIIEECTVTESDDVVVSDNSHGLRSSVLSLHDSGGMPYDVWLLCHSYGSDDEKEESEQAVEQEAEQEPEKVGAHKVVLAARSPVFRAMFSGEMVEARSTEVMIDDFSAAAVQAFVRFLYSDQCSRAVLEDCAEELLPMADKYQVPALMVLCESYLATKLSPNNVVSTLKLADAHNAAQLKARALSYIIDNAASTAKHAQELSADLLMDLLHALAEKK
jgi:hypothetical protein